MSYNMNEHMKKKFRSDRPIQGFPAKPRTGNSHGPTKDKMPANQPCKRATAGAKTFGTDKGVKGRQRVLVLFAGTGKRRIMDLADAL